MSGAIWKITLVTPSRRSTLRRANFLPVRQKGSHVTWQHVRYPEITVHLAIGDGDDARHYQEVDIRDAIAAVNARDRERSS